MQVLPLPSSLVTPHQRQFLTCFLVNETLAVDCGSLAFFATPQQQARVQHIVLSHSHLDHVASLPMFLDNAYDGSGHCVVLHATPGVLDCLQKDLFNNRLWPDFIGLSKKAPPFVKLEPLTPGQTLTLAGLRITPVPVNHVVECMGFVVEDDQAAVIFSSDTGPTEELWRRAHQLPHLKGVFLEATFPQSLTRLAGLAQHLTPALFAGEVAKMPPGVRVLALHLHAKHRAQVEGELRALNLPHLEIVEFGRHYVF